ncbi:MAG: transcription antitermination factor NusB [Candidatus Tectomicrobia bacterium]|uniref:Transcription antitermination protein NusB n=1 Tax=Tectimicrobiota bacterium TaxID=2528274 RepID=A0A937VYN0_UNCTE|nr:transcription antitermination factor NusB [Candidatus Tectomicrobia bacterium]
MGRRRQSREAALQLLYALDITRASVRDVLRETWAEAFLFPDIRDFTTTLVTGVMEHRDEIDVFIQDCSTNWALERIGLVERNILRFAIYELCFLPDIPPNVTINEAVEVAKKYGTEDAPAFINGILDRIKHAVGSRALALPVALSSYAL